MEALLVPETSSEVVSDEEVEVDESPTEAEDKDIPSEEISTEETEVAENTSSPEEDTQVQEEKVVEEAPSEDELEAKRAEEAELREVGAGEEPATE